MDSEKKNWIVIVFWLMPNTITIQFLQFVNPTKSKSFTKSYIYKTQKNQTNLNLTLKNDGSLEKTLYKY